ncbi:MAG: arginase family protein [Planctomycetes bacterium]|nr:arginase family protein [Planctomycetota bacterium]
MCPMAPIRPHCASPNDLATLVTRFCLVNAFCSARLRGLPSGVHAFTMQDIDMRGMAGVMQEAINLATRNTDYLHVSFDIDSVDPKMAPGTGTAVFGGLTYREAHLALELVADSGRLTSFEMVEVNPILDNYNMTGELASGLIASALGKTIL